jgi:hypothetical protein
MGVIAPKYSALRDFLRGYLHEDFAVEHKTLARAVRSFKMNADWDRAALVAHQMHRFIEEHQGTAIEKVNKELGRLGCAYEFVSWDELLEFERLLYS